MIIFSDASNHVTMAFCVSQPLLFVFILFCVVAVAPLARNEFTFL
jgi:hypothetical protein